MNMVVLYGIEKRGCTWQVAQLLLGHFADWEISEFYFPRDFSEACAGCNRCFYEGEDKCPHAARVQPIWRALEAADVIVAAAPVFLMHIPGQLKQFFDHLAHRWPIHRPSAAMYSKIGVTLSTVGGMGLGGAKKGMKGNFTSWGIPKTYSYGMRPMAVRWEDVQPAVREKTARQLARLAAKIRARAGNVRVGPGTRSLFGLFRFAHRRFGSFVIPYDNAYWRSQGWLNKNRPWKKEKQ